MPISQRRKQRYLDHLAKTGAIMESCDVAGISHESVRKWRKKDEEFRAQEEDAEMRFCDTIDIEIKRRAIDGWDEPVFGSAGPNMGTEKVGVKRKYSDALLLALAKSRIARYKDKAEVEVNASQGAVVVVPARALSEEDFDKQVKQ